MIHATTDFYNKAASEIRQTYFPAEDHGRTENPNYHKANKALEDFNNGCLTYRKLIGRLAKNCHESTCKIHAIVSNYVVSFGSYNYKPKKLNS